MIMVVSGRGGGCKLLFDRAERLWQVWGGHGDDAFHGHDDETKCENRVS